MTVPQLNNKIGSYKKRQLNTGKLANELKLFLESLNYNVAVAGPFAIKNQQRLTSSTDFCIEYRAKKSAAIIKKMERFNEDLNEILDIYALRLILPSVDLLDKVSKEIKNGLWKNPTKKEMTIRGGKLSFSSFRDYRKRDWPGVSPLTGQGYDNAIHMNRKTEFCIAEIQIVTRDLYDRYYGDKEEGHKKFKKRQEKYFSAKNKLF